MAVSESIRVALDTLFDVTAEMESFLNALESMNPGEPPPVVSAFRCQFARLSRASDDVEVVIRSKALPLIQDFEKSTNLSI